MPHNGLRAFLLGTSLLLMGCGVTYHSPTVQSQAAGLNVQVVQITASSVKQANRAPYSPLDLPDAFHSVASGSGMRGMGAMPDIPQGPDQSRKKIATNLPAQVAAPRYKIGVGDVVVMVTKNSASTIEELGGLLTAQTQRQGFTVRDNGMISLPDIGQVNIAGKAPYSKPSLRKRSIRPSAWKSPSSIRSTSQLAGKLHGQVLCQSP